MAINRGKQFEAQFRKDWASSVPDSLCYRLIDATSGYYGIRNVCDFICYKYPYLLLIDCKSSDGNTIGFDAIRQFEDMCKYCDIPGIVPGIIWWSIPNDAVVFVPATTLRQIKKEGLKSFNYKKMINDPNYSCYEIPSKKLRTFLKSDYSTLLDYVKEIQDGRQ